MAALRKPAIEAEELWMTQATAGNGLKLSLPSGFDAAPNRPVGSVGRICAHSRHHGDSCARVAIEF